MDTNTANAKALLPACTGMVLAVLAAGFIGGEARAAPGAQPAARGRPAVVAQGEPCRSCGVVESVVPVRRQAPVKGIGGSKVTPGMAIGGVAGGLLGNQLGHGNGRAATTVIGAAGGAYAGHAIEKNRNQYTAYVMHIRMHDGSMRRIEQRTAIAKGSSVVVTGKTAHLASRAPVHG
ncbi:MAG TPA: glycine zipper 2TM domain-containing protein [Ramlibacter sp.]|nr:glycine zipper 2TM domain-containing protein [Ramlibacter sp.]